MTKLEDTKGILDFLRSDIMFWITLITIVVGVVIKFTTLSDRVSASEEKIQTDHQLLQSIDQKTNDILIHQATTQKDVEYLITHNK